MSWATLGTLALPFHLQRVGAQARSDLARHSHELTTGQVQSAARHLRGDLGALHAVENRLVRIAGFEAALKQTATAFEVAQSSLGRVAEVGQKLAEKLVMTAQASAGPSARGVAALAAKNAMDETISALSQSVAGRALFSGTHSDRVPLAGSAELLQAAAEAVGELTDAAMIADRLELFFMTDDGFSNALYHGGPAEPGGFIDDGLSAPPLPTADDPAIRRQLMNMAMVVLMDNGALSLSPEEERTLQQRALTELMGNVPALNRMQAQVGEAQEMLEHRLTRLSVERDRLEIMRSDKIGVDPYKAAMAVEQSRVQLESIYTVTARIARMSLTEYLR
jgi:flagellar hook-associated protein 3 FlgL